MKIIFISDFFLEEGISGGAEICNDELLNLLTKKYNILKIKSNLVNNKILEDNKDSFYIVSNFMFLSEEAKNYISNLKYIIYEHDHKYVSTNDPSSFVDMIVPQKLLINKDFFRKAKAVLCQSKIHSNVIRKNLLLKNVINMGGNFWSDKNLNFLQSKINTKKEIKNAILYSNNINKGTMQAVEYCNKNNIDFYKIEPSSYEDFIEKLSKTEKLYFFPQWLESFNRVSIEAKILNCKIISNKLIGATSEDWFSLYNGQELLNFLKNKNEELIQIFYDILEEKNYQKYFLKSIEIPKISLITSIYKSKKYLKHYIEQIVKQTVFDNCELIFVDSNEDQEDYFLLKPYIEKYLNIKYIKSNKYLNVHESANIAIKNSTGEYLCFSNVDDIKANNSLEILSECLFFDKSVDLVYGECLQTNIINDIFENHLQSSTLYEHSLNDFSKDNMIKCQPGPMPMWRKSLHDKYGYFDENLKFAGDWEFWLRCVENGVKFKKVYERIGLYYMNPEGLSTKKDNLINKKKEESFVFNKYKNVFSPFIFKSYEGYFNER